MSDEAPAYCRFYCEENIWHLCAHPRVAAADRWVLFISNAVRCVAMWGQRSAEDPKLPIAWDYHVILLVRAPGRGFEIWDLDASDANLHSAERYLQRSFDRLGLLPTRYAPRFRLIEAGDYRRHFRSDRRHMYLADGAVRQPPPPWPAIIGEPPACAPVDDGSNLERFIDTQDSSFLGQLFDLAELRGWLGQSRGP